MIFSDKKILESIESKDIVIEPYRPDCLGTNSYDVHLGKWLATYKSKVLDAKKHNAIDEFEIPTEGYVLKPGMLYLGVTEEYTETHNAVPFLEGKSSTGRLGIDIHATAGKGDVGFWAMPSFSSFAAICRLSVLSFPPMTNPVIPSRMTSAPVQMPRCSARLMKLSPITWRFCMMIPPQPDADSSASDG